MASLNGLYDPNATPSAGGSRTVIPTGDYDVIVTGSDIKPNKKNTGDVLHLDVTISSGQYAGETLKYFINLTNASDVAQRIGQGQMAALRKATNVPNPQNTEEFHNKPFRVRIEVKPDSFTNEQGQLVTFDRSNISAILFDEAASGGQPAIGTGVPGQPPAPQVAQQPAATPAAGTKPWEKAA